MVLLVLVATNGWLTKQLEYVMTFPQAPVEKVLFLEVPEDFIVEG